MLGARVVTQIWIIQSMKTFLCMRLCRSLLLIMLDVLLLQMMKVSLTVEIHDLCAHFIIFFLWCLPVFVQITMSHTLPHNNNMHLTFLHTSLTIPSTRKGNISGVVSERDYVCKIALLSKTSKDTAIKEISTKSANLIVASPSETVSDCMAKMLLKDIRHLPLLDEDGGVVGIVSIKDLVKAELKEKQDAIKTLSDFALGKGGHFSAE